jgi:hypothetical protein
VEDEEVSAREADLEPLEVDLAALEVGLEDEEEPLVWVEQGVWVFFRPQFWDQRQQETLNCEQPKHFLQEGQWEVIKRRTVYQGYKPPKHCFPFLHALNIFLNAHPISVHHADDGSPSVVTP